MSDPQTPKKWQIAAVLLCALIGGAAGFIIGFPISDVFIGNRPSESIMVVPLGRMAELLDFMIGSTVIGAVIALVIGLRRR
jgi:hypothetical protein